MQKRILKPATEYPEIKRALEAQGYALPDELYKYLLAYTRRKARCAGKDESYIPYLLPDVVKEYYLQLCITTLTAATAVSIN